MYMEQLLICCGWMSSIQDLMRELDEKEGVIKSVQDSGEHLLYKNHPARVTIEVSPLLCSQSAAVVSLPCI